MQADPRFVGRDEELASFEQMLQDPWGDSRLKFVWGPGGIGKTWLIKEMLKRAQEYLAPERPAQKAPKGYKVPERVLETKDKTTGKNSHKTEVAVIDMYATRNRHLEGVIESIIEQLGLSKDILNEYQIEKGRLLQARQQTGYATQGVDARLSALAAAFRQELSHFVQHQPVVLAFDTFEHVQDTTVGRWILSDQGLQMPGLLCLIASRKPNPFDLQKPPLGGLNNTQALNFHDLYFLELGQKSKLSKEIADHVISLNKQVGGNPLLLGLALLWPYQQDSSENEQQILSPEKIESGIAARLSPRSRRTLFSGIEEQFQEPLRQTLVCVAYLNRRFNQTLLEHLIKTDYIQGTEARPLWEILKDKLPAFFYVKERPEDEIQLHDKLAEILRLHLLPRAFDDPTGQRVHALADAVVIWYDELIAQTDDPLQRAILQTEKLAYALRMDVIIDTNLPERRDTYEAKQLKRLLPPDFAKAKALLNEYHQQYNDILNRLIVNEIKPDLISHIPRVERYDIFATLGDMARNVYLLEEAAYCWQEALHLAQDINNLLQQIQALEGWANSSWQNNPQLAVNLLKQANELCDKAPAPHLKPDILHGIAFVNRQMQQLEEAVIWYEKALESAEQVEPSESQQIIKAKILNDMGYSLLLIGHYDDAEANISMAAIMREEIRDAWQNKLETLQHQITEPRSNSIREQLSRELHDVEGLFRDATLRLGMTYNTLGQLARQNPSDLTDATGYYAEALAIFNELKNSYWQAHALQAMGDAHRRISLGLHYKKREEKSVEYDTEAFQKIQDSLDLCERYGYVDLLAIVYRRMGRLLHDRALKSASDLERQIGLLKKSLDFFEKGITAAKTSRQVVEELENATEIAFLADDFIRAYRRQRSNRQLSKVERTEVDEYIGRLEMTITSHENDVPQIYQFSVFKDLLAIEWGAYYYELGDYEQSLHYYLNGFTGLASDPGYGSARCRAHIQHLFGNIRKLENPKLRQEWYSQFIRTWETTPMRRGKNQTVAEGQPKLIKEFRLHKRLKPGSTVLPRISV